MSLIGDRWLQPLVIKIQMINKSVLIKSKEYLYSVFSLCEDFFINSYNQITFLYIIFGSIYVRIC